MYSLPSAAFVPGTSISSSSVNADFSDIATALTQSLATTGVSTMTGQFLGASGSAGAPGITFSGATTTGFYLAGANQIGWSAAGTQRATFNSDGTVTWSGAQTAPSFSVSAGGVLVPVGSVTLFAGSTAPTGWQLCYGQAISRATYSALFAVIGTNYGTGDGSTTFNLPDCRGRSMYGQDNMGGVAANRITVAGGNFDGTILGNAGGAQNHTLTTAEMPVHNHGVTDNGHSHGPFSGAHWWVPGSGLGFTTGNFGGPFDDGTGNTQSATSGISIQNAGSGNSHTVLSPAIIFNVIIFSGAP